MSFIQCMRMGSKSISEFQEVMRFSHAIQGNPLGVTASAMGDAFGASRDSDLEGKKKKKKKKEGKMISRLLPQETTRRTKTFPPIDNISG